MGFRLRALVGLALSALFLVSWIVLPPPSHHFVPLAVGAPEVSGWLLAASLLVAMLNGVAARRSRLARIGLTCSLTAAALAALPLVQFGPVARRASEDRRAVTGDATTAALDVVRLFAGVRTADVLIARGIPVGSPGGVPLTVDVYQPISSSGARPAIVQIYGRAWQRGAPGDDSTLAAWFAGRGYVVFAIDYRHAPAFRWPAQIDDVRAALDWIAAHAREYVVDTNRIALVGRSAGGHLALMAAYTSTRPIRAVVSLYGPTDLAAGYRELPRPDPLDVRLLLQTLTGGTPDDRPGVYREASPITYATRPLPPTLLIHGSRDHIVLPQFARRLHERLRATGTTSLLVEIPWAEHAFDALPNGPSAQLALFEIERFLEWGLR